LSEEIDKSKAIKSLYSLELEKDDAAFSFLGYAGIVLRSNFGNLAFDIANVLQVKDMKIIDDIDLLFYTHVHGDHFNLSKAIRFQELTNSHIVAEADVMEKLDSKIPSDSLTLAEPGRDYKKLSVKGYTIKAVRGVHSGSFSQFHVRKNKLTVFHAGDSGYFGLGKFSTKIAFIPTGAPSPWCAPEVALAMALHIKPKIAVATHGTDKQMKRFRNLMQQEMPDVEVVIPEKFKPIKLKL
jgi:L-ascorbate metabolism protein UlaG (beta-lactamase superfamily)